MSDQPIIGLTCHRHDSEIVRSAVNQQYVEALAHAGAAPVCVPLGLDRATLRRIYDTLDGVLLPGGDDVSPTLYNQQAHPRLGRVDPVRDDLEVAVARWALEDDIPLLGICRGIQVLAVAAGGTLYQDLPSDLQDAFEHDIREFGRDYLCHDITVEEGSLLCRVIGCTTSRVNSLHHQAVRDLPPGFTVAARSCDGVIEAIEAPDRQFALGIQCHPEGMWRSTAPEFGGLFSAFVDAARGSRRRMRAS